MGDGRNENLIGEMGVDQTVTKAFENLGADSALIAFDDHRRALGVIQQHFDGSKGFVLEDPRDLWILRSQTLGLLDDLRKGMGMKPIATSA